MSLSFRSAETDAMQELREARVGVEIRKERFDFEVAQADALLAAGVFEAGEGVVFVAEGVEHNRQRQRIAAKHFAERNGKLAAPVQHPRSRPIELPR
jgi:hypothetical protein